MIIYSNGRFKSLRPADEALAMIQQQVADLSPQERTALEVLVQELAGKQKQEIADAAERLEWDPDTGPPVPIRQWVNDEQILGETAKTLWPKLKEDMVEFFEGDYSECILTGCIDQNALIHCANGAMPRLGDFIKSPQRVITTSLESGVHLADCSWGKDSGVKRVVTLTLRNGMTLKLTPDHKVMTPKGWIETQHLKPGIDRVVVPRKINYEPDNFSTTDDEIKLMAYWATDGSSDEYRARYCDGNVETTREVVRSLQACGFDVTRDPYLKNGSWEILVQNYRTSRFDDWLKQHELYSPKFGDKTSWVYVPDKVCRAPLNQVALFLNRVWAAEGTVYDGGVNSAPRFQLSMKSERFIKQVQLLLLRFGILGTVGYNESERNGTPTHAWCIQVSGKEQIDRFFEHIGPIFGKEASTAKIINAVASKKANTNVDVVPFTYGEAGDLLKKHGLSRRLHCKERGGVGWNRLNMRDRHFSRPMLRQFCEDYRDCAPEIAQLQSQFPESASYEYVVSVTDDGESLHVADVEVPDTSCFIVNGVSVHNSTRWGKDYFGTTALIRVIYELYCLKKPTDTLGLGRGEIISIVPISHTKEAAQRVVFEGITRKLFLSPFWKGRFEVTKEEIRFPGKDIVIVAGGSSEGAALGLNVWAALLDEGNFMGKHKKDHVSAGGGKEDKSESIYDSMRRRIRGTYAAKGLRGRLFLISSKKSIHDFTERRIREAMKESDSSVFVRDYATWDVRPNAFEGQKWWRAAVSQTIGRVRVLDDVDQPEDHEIWFKFPDEYLKDFKNDPAGAARDIAGIALEAFRPFFSNREAINEMMKPDRAHPFHIYEWRSNQEIKPIWENLVMKNVHGDPVARCCPNAHRHVHLDLSKNRDATGFCVGHAAGEVEVTRLDPESHERKREEAPLIHIDLCLRILPPVAGEIEHQVVRSLVYMLREGGLPIRSVSADRWMGLPNLQLISQHGFKTEEISTQRTLDPYLATQSALYERRIESPIYKLLAKELRELELNEQGTKVDHPKTGSKDLSDALAGVVYYLSRNWRQIGIGSVSKGISQAATGVPGVATPTSDGNFRWPDEPPPLSEGGEDFSGLPTWII